LRFAVCHFIQTLGEDQAVTCVSVFWVLDSVYFVSMIHQAQSHADTNSRWKIACTMAFALALLAVGALGAQQTTPSPSPSNPSVSNDAQKGAILLTIFLRHDQSKTLDEINAGLRKNGYYKAFPPAGIEVVSWYVMMGIGQVVTLRVPPDRLRDVNLALEKTAWGGYRTEFYPTYDYKAIGEAERSKAQ
jgi:hypothetical protein